MAQQSGSGKTREERVAEQLRANLARRKEQARSRRKGDADRRPEGVALPAGDPAAEDEPSDQSSQGSEKALP